LLKPYYNSGDLIGNKVLKKSYEEILRGIKVKYFQKTNTIEIGSYKDGKYDTIAVQGGYKSYT
jgi:penicillin-binding protein 2